ncbi:RNA 2',3'-cyclic phosphodiesterase [Planococcus shenhongbingii]|uniref:RNA 2',3'-cyclic phosphodiesterase n=1 Tax=Planococcus shenhongbingii TaxID=3058398 RepID=A0ABT8NDY2_9BACL|nr:MULTISPECIES: RNA 2',3'-cyclic phosphodiesterase [unclassified Planococcus (in: firmicutes)]MDN7246051.1 RNA 2',3'-cyclic phosphodiesterase [Planococcus sp. N017]WKA59819.1 RNA 2',3'-cyclic phosphodiesterase [Planococcus sp. N016]
MQAHYFIGVKIPEPVAKEMDKARRSWNLKSHKRYTHWSDMHITLLFIGNDPHNEIQAAAQELANISHPPFELTTGSVKTFGNPAKPRIIYASVGDSSELADLQRNVKEALLRFNLSPDTKAFVPHITLAGKWAGGPPLEIEMEIEPMTFQVTEFSLFRIEPGSVPKYIPEFTYQLRKGV